MSEFNKDFEALGIDLMHHMPDDGSGVYIKQTRIPAGVKLQMHTHTFTHKSVLCSGKVLLRVDGEILPVQGPAVLTVKEGQAHEVEAVTEAVWLCIHATDELDPERIDHTLVRA